VERPRLDRPRLQRPRLLRVLAAVVVLTSAAAATPVRLRCEYLENPLGIDAASPRFSWQSDNSERNWMQAAYQVLVASNDENLRSGKADVWDSGKVDSAESVGIVYRGPALESRKRYYWKVRVWDAAGQVSESTEAAWWEMGLLHATDWKAKWIRWQNRRTTPTVATSAGFGWRVKMRSRLCRRQKLSSASPSISLKNRGRRS
jgi:hypothetical protein